MAIEIGALLKRAVEVEATYKVCDGVYILGSLEKGLTLYNQQVRAHNLIWALWELQRGKQKGIGRVAVVGGGAAGLTVAAGLLSRFSEGVEVTLLERFWDICALQQGADTRWLHPRIYSWPAVGSRAPGASLPLLNWSEGRASDVARQLSGSFGRYCDQYGNGSAALSIYIGVTDLKLDVKSRSISWKGTRALRSDSFFHPDGEAKSNSEHFDVVVLAAGFGIERTDEEFTTESYWRNEQLAQPRLDAEKKTWLISGYGDGALVDLCRLTIERFRQDTILYELFGTDLGAFESQLMTELDKADQGAPLNLLLQNIPGERLSAAATKLTPRLRKDTNVILNARGRKAENKSVEAIFGSNSSVLNRVLTYLLHQCDAFKLDFNRLKQCAIDNCVEAENIVCRHGTDIFALLQSIILNFSTVENRLKTIEKVQAQIPEPMWEPGSFPITN
jgi:FAD dependent oxidoreductase